MVNPDQPGDSSELPLERSDGSHPDQRRAATKLLKPLLSEYPENRRRWPLWTYARGDFSGKVDQDLSDYHKNPPEPQDRLTWKGSSAWADRLRWSPFHHLNTTERELIGHCEEATSERVARYAHWNLGDAVVVLEVAQRDENIPPGSRAATSRLMRALQRGNYEKIREEPKARVTIRFVDSPIPVSFYARVVAFLNQLAPQVPTCEEQLQLPSTMHDRGFDRGDFEELTTSLMNTLMAAYDPDRSSFCADMGAEEQERTWERAWIDPRGPGPGSSLLEHILAQGSLDRENPLSSRARAGVILLERVGLLPNRQGGSRNLLGNERLLQLAYAEAEEIVRAVQAWTPRDTTVQRLIEYKKSSADRPETVAFEAERALRGRPESDILVNAVCLRFPFLTFAEVKHLRASKSSDRERDSSSPKQIARWLLMHRSPAWNPDQDDASFQVTLSKARRSA